VKNSIFACVKPLLQLDHIEDAANASGMSLFYFSRPDCGVCKAIRPKVEQLTESYPQLSSYYVDLDSVPEAAGTFSIFTIPAVLVYANGKETVREARYFSIYELEERIERYYRMLFSEGN